MPLSFEETQSVNDQYVDLGDSLWFDVFVAKRVLFGASSTLNFENPPW